MALHAGYNKTSQNDLVQGVNITLLAQGIAAQPRIYQDIALIGEPTLPTWRIVSNDLITVDATLTETDEAAFTSFTTAGVEITPAMYPVRSYLSYELMQDSAEDVVSKAITEHLDVLVNAADANTLANISSATNTDDYTGTSLDKAKFEASLLGFKKQVGRDGGEIIFVGSYRQIHEIIVAYGNSSGSVFAVPGVASSAVAGDPSFYFRGSVAGVKLFEGKVPASGGADVSGAFMVRSKALAIGFWAFAEYKIDPAAGRPGVELLTWSRYGTGIAKQANLREVISLA